MRGKERKKERNEVVMEASESPSQESHNNQTRHNELQTTKNEKKRNRETNSSQRITHLFQEAKQSLHHCQAQH